MPIRRALRRTVIGCDGPFDHHGDAEFALGGRRLALDRAEDQDLGADEGGGDLDRVLAEAGDDLFRLARGPAG